MEYILIDTGDKLIAAADILQKNKVIAVDTETTGLNPHSDKLRLIQLAYDASSAYIIDCYALLPRYSNVISDILTGKAVKIFQNAKFDIQFLWANDIEISGPIFDTYLAARVLYSSGGPQRAGLDVLARHYLDEDLSKEEQKSDFSGQLREKQLIYAAKDAKYYLGCVKP